MSLMDDIRDKVQKFLESEKGQNFQKKIENFGVNLAKKIDGLSDKNPIKKLIGKMYKGSINFSNPQDLKGLMNIQDRELQKEQVEQFPIPNILKQKENLKDKMSPEKWAKRAAKIKRNTKKLMIKAGSMSVKLMTIQAKIAGKLIKFGGHVTKAAGYTIQGAALVGKTISKATSVAGKGLKVAGSAIQKGCATATKAAAGIPYVGALVAAVPAVGVGLGAATNFIGIGMDKGGMIAEKGCDTANRAGKQTVKTGNNIIQTGKKTEMVAKRIDNIRKYFAQKALTKIKHQEVQSQIEDAQKQQQIMRLKNPLAYESAQKQATPKTITPNMAVLLNKKGREQ